MTETDNEQLLRSFFSEAQSQQIADDGFTQRVMHQLPAAHSPRLSAAALSRLWTVFCCLVFVVLFVVFRGWELLAVQVEVTLRTLAATSFSINPLMLATVLFGLLFVGVGEAVSRA